MHTQLHPAQPYIGRFAPSPTGGLHLGSLVAALASWLDARAHHGIWRVRMEDVDTLRWVRGAETLILQQLTHFGLTWDGEVLYQSQRTALYTQALMQLPHCYACGCPRTRIKTLLLGVDGPIYDGHCRGQTAIFLPDTAIRITVPDAIIHFDDRLFGRQQQNLAHDVGDFIVRRRDGLFSYQLAVVVDDAAQGITHVVRGADILPSTARQIFLQQQLGYATPQYAHLPLVLGADGSKLSKQSFAPVLPINTPPEPYLYQALHFLGLVIPADLNLADLLAAAVVAWGKSLQR